MERKKRFFVFILNNISFFFLANEKKGCELILKMMNKHFGVILMTRSRSKSMMKVTSVDSLPAKPFV